MEPEKILQSDLIDIIFENKNKEYGAYTLRKNYNKRLLQALGGTCLLVSIFVVLQSMKPTEQTGEGSIIIPDVHVTSVVIPKDDDIKKTKPKEVIKQTEKIKTVTNFVPVIKPDKKVIETTVNTTETLDNNTIGNKTIDGKLAQQENTVVSLNTINTTGTEKKVTEETNDLPLTHADVMPAFNGDIIKFMLRNLEQPNDLEAGQKIMVRVKFVVTKDGSIDDIQIMQSGRPDLDQEVIRVVKKMPRWHPGMQGGKNVPVYFYLPVTFVSNGE